MNKVFFLILVGLMPWGLYAADGSTMAERLPGHEESWIALVIALTSLGCAWFMNNRMPTVRAFGTLLAALGCLAVAGWFVVYVIGPGFLQEPKPYDTPLDAAKPWLLWGQSLLAMIAGLGLLRVSVKQLSDKRSLHLTRNNEPYRYGLVSRVLHWTIAILILVMIPMGIFATMIPEGTAYRLEYYVVHKTIGVAIFVLVIFRLVWNRVSKRPALDSGLKPVERKLAHGVHLALYAMMIAFPLTGFIMTSYFGAPTYFFIWEMAPLWETNESAVLLWGVLHKYLLPYLVYVILGAHILGALKHQFFDKHTKVLKRMVS